MQKQTHEAGGTRKPSRVRNSKRASDGASRSTEPRGYSPALAHSEVWTMGDLMDYASEQGFTIELTRLTDTPRK